MSDELIRLPQGWIWTSIGDFAEVTKLAGFEFTNYFNYQELADVRVVRGLNIGFGEFKAENFKYIDASISDALPRSRLGGGEVLITYVGTLGSVAVLPNDGNRYHLGPNVGKISVKDEVSEAKYLMFFLLSPSGKRSIHQTSKAVAQSSLSMKQIRLLNVPLPPLNEQKRIVAKIEELRDRHQRAKQALEAIPELCDRFRQSVLAAAFRGDLTADWRDENPDVEPASVLLERVRRDREKQFYEFCAKAKENGVRVPKKPGLLFEDISNLSTQVIDELPTWIRIKLNALLPDNGIFDGPFGSNLKTSDYTESGVRVIRLENIGILSFIADKESYISQDKYQALLKHTVYENDLIFSSFIADSVRVCLLPKLNTPAIAKADCFCLRPDIELVNREFLALQFSSPSFFSHLQEFSHGATRLRVNTTQLRTSTVFICPIEEQREIVRRVNLIFNLIEQVKQHHQEAKDYLTHLNQSILAKAFRGELVEQDLNDEPASVLLERIRAEREKADSGKKTKGKRAKQLKLEV